MPDASNRPLHLFVSNYRPWYNAPAQKKWLDPRLKSSQEEKSEGLLVRRLSVLVRRRVGSHGAFQIPHALLTGQLFPHHRPCKARKIKCDEARPSCENCLRFDDACDYSIRLNWDGRAKKDGSSSSTLLATAPAGSAAFVQYQPLSTDAKPTVQTTKVLLSPTIPDHILVASRARKSSPPSASSVTTTPSLSQAPLSSSTSSSHWPTKSSGDAAFDHYQTQKRRRLNSSASRGSTGSISFEPVPTQKTQPTPDESPTRSASLTPSGPGDPQLIQFDSSAKLGSTRLSIDTASGGWPSKGGRSRRDSSFTYGFDQGRPDVDVPKNDDARALAVFSPSSTLRKLPDTLCPGDDGHPVPEFGFGFHVEEAEFRLDDYYMQAVPVQIPHTLEPLPSMLHANPMNLLYFHHFVNHTARILVPHDCPENPFRLLLPKMALRDGNLMSLLLAYSASHRARLLKHPEPRTRIALWVSNVFPSLRLAISGKGPISDSSLATAIMQASLEIISPNAFGVPIAWQSYLQTARSMIIARGGYRALRDDHVAYFLSRWFGYLDVCGSLSGSSYDAPLTSDFELSDAEYGETEAELDCMMGFTVGCTLKLAKVAALARTCDAQRINGDGEIRTDWKPSADVVEVAERLKQKLLEPRPEVVKRCQHQHAPRDEDEATLDKAESTAVNDAYHWAGLIHLHCRVFGKASHDRDVQTAVQGVVMALEHIRKNSSAEACMVLPLFAAGCQMQSAEQRNHIMNRLLTVEKSGMSQVHKARTLMEAVWSTGRPWETLVQGEFVG